MIVGLYLEQGIILTMTLTVYSVMPGCCKYVHLEHVVLYCSAFLKRHDSHLDKHWCAPPLRIVQSCVHLSRAACHNDAIQFK